MMATTGSQIETSRKKVPSRIGILRLRTATNPWTDAGFIESPESQALLCLLNHYHSLPELSALRDGESEPTEYRRYSTRVLPVVLGLALHGKCLSNRRLLFTREFHQGMGEMRKVQRQINASLGGVVDGAEEWPALGEALKEGLKLSCIPVEHTLNGRLPDHVTTLHRKFAPTTASKCCTPLLNSGTRGPGVANSASGNFWESWLLHSLRQGVVPRKLRLTQPGQVPSSPLLDEFFTRFDVQKAGIGLFLEELRNHFGQEEIASLLGPVYS